MIDWYLDPPEDEEVEDLGDEIDRAYEEQRYAGFDDLDLNVMSSYERRIDNEN